MFYNFLLLMCKKPSCFVCTLLWLLIPCRLIPLVHSRFNSFRATEKADNSEGCLKIFRSEVFALSCYNMYQNAARIRISTSTKNEMLTHTLTSRKNVLKVSKKRKKLKMQAHVSKKTVIKIFRIDEMCYVASFLTLRQNNLAGVYITY